MTSGSVDKENGKQNYTAYRKMGRGISFALSLVVTSVLCGGTASAMAREQVQTPTKANPSSPLLRYRPRFSYSRFHFIQGSRLVPVRESANLDRLGVQPRPARQLLSEAALCPVPGPSLRLASLEPEAPEASEIADAGYRQGLRPPGRHSCRARVGWGLGCSPAASFGQLVPTCSWSQARVLAWSLGR